MSEPAPESIHTNKRVSEASPLLVVTIPKPNNLKGNTDFSSWLWRYQLLVLR